MVSSKPRQYFTPGKDPVSIVQEAGWAPRPGWTSGKSRPTGIRSPDRPARSSVAIQTGPPGPLKTHDGRSKIKFTRLTFHYPINRL